MPDALPAMPPLIGMPARMDSGSAKLYLSRDYADAIADSGGIPVILPLLETCETLGPIAGRLDGVLLTGNAADVDPSRYGAIRDARCGSVQPLRDATDLYLLESAAIRRIPILAICYGLQVLNVFKGGSLIQDIPTRVATDIRHDHPGKEGGAEHDLDIVPGSFLEKLAGMSRTKVNSTHHQAVDKVGNGLNVIARAPDGIVEALLGDDSSQWILGVQWHPEKSFTVDAFSRAIFKEFIDQCRARINQ